MSQDSNSTFSTCSKRSRFWLVLGDHFPKIRGIVQTGDIDVNWIGSFAIPQDEL